MQIFELNFNPNSEDDKTFDSFVHQPENVYERKLGALFMAGEIKNSLPADQKLLINLIKNLKKYYYSFSLKSQEKALSLTLKKANEFLDQEVKKENIGWLGNLDFSAASIKDFNFSFTKVGSAKILLSRAGKIIDAGKNLDSQEMDPFPLKIFYSVVSAKLIPKDIIIILTKEISDFFSQKEIIPKISKIEKLDLKKIKEIFPPALLWQNEKLIPSGLCLIIIMEENEKTGHLAAKESSENFKKIVFQREKIFSFRKSFAAFFKKNIAAVKKAISSLKFNRLPKKIEPKTKEIILIKQEEENKNSFPIVIKSQENQQLILAKVEAEPVQKEAAQEEIMPKEKNKGFQFKFPKLNFPKIKFPKMSFPKIKFPSVKFPEFSKILDPLKSPKNKKRLKLVLGFIVLLVLGFLIFGR